MAGPGKRGRPTADERVDQVLFKADALAMRMKGFTHQQIADTLGCDRSTISHLFPQIFRDILDENGAQQLRATELHRLEQITVVMWPKLVGDGTDTSFAPHKDDVMAYLAISRRKAQLVGADAPDRFTYIPPNEEQLNDITNPKIAATVRMSELMDAVAKAGLGSGRRHDVIDADTADLDPDDDDEYEDAEANDDFQPTAAPVSLDSDGQVVRSPSLTSILRGTPDNYEDDAIPVDSPVTHAQGPSPHDTLDL
jgi:hypothetical protein